jgi:single-strand DNA-binding protein
MNHLNSLLLEGNLVKGPEFTDTPDGISVCKFMIASKRFYKVDDEYKEEVSFFDIRAWDDIADVCKKWFGKERSKGIGVRIVGRLKQDRRKGKSEIYVVADHVEFKPNLDAWKEDIRRQMEEKTIDPGEGSV